MRTAGDRELRKRRDRELPLGVLTFVRKFPKLGRVLLLALVSGISVLACAEVGTSPNAPAAIELPAYPSPSVVIGDTLRDLTGRVAGIRAIVRNVRGEEIADAPTRYLYADALRDSALAVDSITGVVRALRASKGTARLAARVGASLQVLREIIITTRPDSVDRNGQPGLALFTTTFPDTGRAKASANSSPTFNVNVRHIDSTKAPTGVNAWPVRFELISPVNATNDTTRSVYLVDDSGRPSVLDTTDASGTAGRKVRIRAQLFPIGTAIDSVIVRAVITHRGVAVKGSPIRMALPVKRGI